MYNRDEIGKRIKSARQEKHLSQMQFAELINVSTPYLSDIENGKTNLSLDIFTRIVEVLQISADWLIMADIPQTMEYSSAELSRLLADCSVSESKAILKMAENLKEILRSQNSVYFFIKLGLMVSSETASPFSFSTQFYNFPHKTQYILWCLFFHDDQNHLYSSHSILFFYKLSKRF